MESKSNGTPTATNGQLTPVETVATVADPEHGDAAEVKLCQFDYATPPPELMFVPPHGAMVVAAEEDKSKGAVNWFVLWTNFAEYTTLHGFRQIAEDTDYMFRRIFWVVITVFAFGLLMYQMGNSISLYASRPVAYNVKRMYYNEMEFPAITICNQNVFRITQAWGEQLYTFLERMYDVNYTEVSHLSGVNESLIQVLDKMKHEKEDLILACTWNRAYRCSAKDLLKVYVDNSICYTFNGVGKPKKTSLTGSGSGLNLLMNIEQYEFMRTRSLTAGIQVYVHDQGALPREAISIPPGMKAFIRVNTKHVSLLSSPYGVCDSRRLSYYPMYSTAACLSECREDWLMRQCGCHSGALPQTANVSKSVCSIQSYSSCIIPNLAKYTPAIGSCNCPTECEFRRYGSFISFSQISTFDVDQALKHLPADTDTKLIKAREVFYQVNGDKRYLTVNKTLEPFINVTEMVHKNMLTLLRRIQTVQDELARLKKDVYHRFKFHHYLMDRAVYAVKNNWQRGFEVAKERTFSLVAFAYLPLLYSIDLFYQMHDNPNVSRDDLMNLQSLLNSRLYEKEQIASRALVNMTKIHGGFANTILLLTYKVTPERYYDYDFAPESVITANAKDEQRYYDKFFLYTNQLIYYLGNMRGLIKNMTNPGHKLNMTAYHEAQFYIEKRSRSFNYYLYLYDDRIVKSATLAMNARRDNFVKFNDTFFEAHSKLSYKLTNLKAILKNLEEHYDKSGKIVVNIASNYIKQTSSLDYNLTYLSTFINRGPAGKLLESFASGLDSIEVYRLTLMQDLWLLDRALINSVQAVWDDSVERPYRRYSRDLKTLCQLKASASKKLNITAAQLLAIDNRTEVNVTTINVMRKSVFEMAKKSKGKTNCDDVLSSTNSDWMLEGRSSVIGRLKRQMTAMQDAVTLIGKVTGLKEEVALNVMNLKSFTMDFLEGNKISRKFVTDNFVELQIYFQDLVSVDESQSPAYTMTQLWSDFGGNFGLLLGASALSVIEMVDFLIHEILKTRR